jgi:hypothetical protein
MSQESKNINEFEKLKGWPYAAAERLVLMTNKRF